MGCKSSDGLLRVFGCGAKVIAVALKQDEAVAEYAEVIESLAEVIGHGAQVFADDDKAAALTFEGQDTQKIVEIITDIGTIASAHAVGNPVQTGEPHDMVETNCAGSAGSAANRFDEIAVAGIGVALWMKGGEAPVLAIFIEVIGRRSYADFGSEEVLVGPVIGTDAIRCKGKVVIEAEGVAHGFDLLVGVIELLLEAHFDECEEIDKAGEFEFQCAGCFGVWGLKSRRPMMPVPGVWIAAVEVPVKRHVGAVVVEPGSAAFTVVFQFRGRLLFELPVEQKQEEGLDAGDLFVFDQIGFPQGSELSGDFTRLDETPN